MKHYVDPCCTQACTWVEGEGWSTGIILTLFSFLRQDFYGFQRQFILIHIEKSWQYHFFPLSPPQPPCPQSTKDQNWNFILEWSRLQVFKYPACGRGRCALLPMQKTQKSESTEKFGNGGKEGFAKVLAFIVSVCLFCLVLFVCFVLPPPPFLWKPKSEIRVANFYLALRKYTNRIFSRAIPEQPNFCL